MLQGLVCGRDVREDVVGEYVWLEKLGLTRFGEDRDVVEGCCVCVFGWGLLDFSGV